jgi:hypothetical protein
VSTPGLALVIALQGVIAIMPKKQPPREFARRLMYRGSADFSNSAP